MWSYGANPPDDWRHCYDDPRNKPQPRYQKPVFEGSYIGEDEEEEEDACTSSHNLNPPDESDSIERGTSNPAFQNHPQTRQHPAHPQDQALPEQCEHLQHQPSAEFIHHYQPDYEGYRPPPNNFQIQTTGQQPACPASTVQGYEGYRPPPNNLQMQEIGQQPAYSASTVQDYEGYRPPPNNLGIQAIGQRSPYPTSTIHDPGSVVITYPPPANGQYVVTQPQTYSGQPQVYNGQPQVYSGQPQVYSGQPQIYSGQSQVYSGQPPVLIAQPFLDDPPNDYMCYSVFVSVCCCWFVGFIAIFRSIECRKAVAIGNHELAKQKSIATRNTANGALLLGILVYVIAGIAIGVRVAALTKHL